MGRIAGRFVRVEPRRRARAFMLAKDLPPCSVVGGPSRVTSGVEQEGRWPRSLWSGTAATGSGQRRWRQDSVSMVRLRSLRRVAVSVVLDQM